jgi:rSAM/selenodomain-associated transferase 2
VISVVIPVLNEAQALPLALERVRPLFSGHEIIVVDGGSDDGTPDLAASYAGVRVIESPPGRGRQIDCGAEGAEGDVLLVLHADAGLDGGSPAAIEEAVASGARWGWHPVRYRSTCKALGLVARSINAAARVLSAPFGEHAMFATREAWTEAGGCPHVPLLEDLILARRLRTLGRGVPLAAGVEVSARRYERWGVMRMGLVSSAILVGGALGIDPRKLERLYPDVR